MDQLKIVRTICLFTNAPSLESFRRLDDIAGKLTATGVTVQTRRLCSPDAEGVFRLDQEGDGSVYLSVGCLTFEQANDTLDRLCKAKNVAFNVDLTREKITTEHACLLAAIIRKNASKTFSFTYTFHNAISSPYFPSATYERNGFAIGLQPTDLSKGCDSMGQWLHRMRQVWIELDELMTLEVGYLGIDTSIASLFRGTGSFVNLIKRFASDFNRAVTSDAFVRIARFIKEENPRPVGLCGLMFPCLEDFELAAEYERGNFSVERCLFLALHSGLGIDAYPIGVDEDPERVTHILRLMQSLSNKYGKPLSARFISDGVAKIGERTNLKNDYLDEVTIRPL